MSAERDVSGHHYSRGVLRERLRAALTDDGVDPDHPSLDALAPYDQFHGRGLEATVEMADALAIGAADRILDIGSGIGGPARYFANRFGCRVAGIDLTAEFCDVARELTRAVGLDAKLEFRTGDALAMPFANESFDGAYSMNVSMNIADKAALYREIHRVLKPGGWLMLSEIAKGAGSDPDYPTPWAANAETSFLASPEAIRSASPRPASLSCRCAARASRRSPPSPARAPWSIAARNPRIAPSPDTRRDRRRGDGEYGARARRRTSRADRSAR